jgi:transcriptional regulator with XRE-family HTH domain
VEISREELLVLGTRIKNERELKGLSQTELANIIGKDQPSLNRVEKGRVNPSYLFLLEISRGLNLPLWELLK